MKNVFIKLLASVFFLATVTTVNLKAQKVGDPAPDFSLQTLKGTTFTLSANKGKVVFIFLFGNNCPHCLANAPNTQGIYETFMSNPDFEAIGVDVWNGSASSVQGFKNRTGLTYPIAIEGATLTSKYSSTYDRILIVDQEGTLVYKATSNATSGVAAMAAEELEELLKGGATGIDNSKLSQNTTRIYPNPISDFAVVQTGFDPGSQIKLELVDLSGRIVLNQSLVADHSGELRLSNLDYPSGMYFLRMRSEDLTRGLRLMITK